MKKAILFFFLGFGLVLFRGIDYLVAVLREFVTHLKFWTLAGSVEFGSFYGFCWVNYDNCRTYTDSKKINMEIL